MAREEDPNLRTQVWLGLNDLVLKIKTKGDSYYRSVPLNYFGDIPPLNFRQDPPCSPTTPKGRNISSSDDSEEKSRTKKRKKPLRKMEISYDDPALEISNQFEALENLTENF